MSARRHLRAVTDDGEIVEEASDAEKIRVLENMLVMMGRSNRALKAMLKAERKDACGTWPIAEAFEDWQAKMVAAGMKSKRQCKLSDDRIDSMRKLFEVGYTLEHFQYANTGLAAFPFVKYGKRYQRGQERDRDVDLSTVCAKARRFEDAARLGYQVERTR